MSDTNLVEATTYAVVNGTVGFSIYMGASLVTGDQTMTAVFSALGMGMLFFASYMMYEQEALDVAVPDTDILGRSKSNGESKIHRLKHAFCPLKKAPMCRFI